MNMTPSSARPALRRLLLIIGIAAALIIFSYGWTVTDIDLSVPQQPTRQQNVGNALRELLSPNVFTQDYTVHNTTTPFAMDCPEGFTPPEPTNDGTTPYIVVTPACGSSNDVVTVQGYNYAPDSFARVNWIATDGERRIRQVIGTTDDNFITDDDGTFSVQVEVPRIRGSAGEMHTVEVQGRFPSGSPRFSETTSTVLEKMVETIFLALIATVISIPISVVLSFFAAHNLMRPVRIPLGNLLISVVLLPIGYLMGTALLGRLGTIVFDYTSGNLSALSAAVLTLGFAAVASTQRARVTVEPPHIFRAILNTILIALVTMVVLGLLGGVGQRIGESAHGDNVLGYLATFIGSLALLIELLIMPLGGIVGAFTLSSVGASLTRATLKHASRVLSHLLGGVLAALSGAIVLGAMAAIGSAAAWLGLLAPVIAAGLAAPLLPLIFRRYFGRNEANVRANKTFATLLSWVGAAVAFMYTFVVLNVGRSLVEGTLPSQEIAVSVAGVTLTQVVVTAMAIGAVLGGAAGALAGIKTNFPIGNVLYNVTRTILNALRSIEPLIMGIVFVIWVGIGPFAGVLALALHSIASLGKLYSEQIESIDTGPIEALQSTGANRLQTIMYAVLPQIIPPYISFTMYRWDINVRMSTIIGFVGGGGIGFLLQQQINLLRYRDAGVAVLAIAIVVSVLDYASAAIRERYT
jgi:phosphonate ABC transporter permease subunit PhnE